MKLFSPFPNNYQHEPHKRSMRTRQGKEGANGFRELLLLTPVLLYISYSVVTEAFTLGPTKSPWNSVNCPSVFIMSTGFRGG